MAITNVTGRSPSGNVVTREARRPTARLAFRAGVVKRVSNLLVPFLVVVPVSLGAEATATADVDTPDTLALTKIIAEVVKPDAKVRILRTDGTYVEGTLISTGRLELLGSRDGQVQTVNLGAVDTLWEMRISKAKGEAIGGAFGLILGVAAGIGLGLGFSSWNCSYSQDCDDADATRAAAIGAFAGGILGGGIGAMIGNVASTGSMQWMERYPVDQSLGRSYK